MPTRMNRTIELLSVIIPCLNEDANIRLIYDDLVQCLRTGLGLACEYIFVDDGSSDQTLERIKVLAEIDGSVKYISFSRNFGQNNALMAGMRVAQGNVIVTLDCDMQHPVDLIPKMIQLWIMGNEIVHARRIVKNKICGGLGTLKKRIFYTVFRMATNLKVKNGVSDFQLLDRKVVDAVCQFYDSADIFMRAIIEWTGFKQAILDYEAPDRMHGNTKYTLFKLIELGLSGIMAFSIKPLRLAFLLTGFVLLWGILSIWYVYQYSDEFMSQQMFGYVLAAVCISDSLVLFMLGIIGEYLGKCFMQGKHRPCFIIKESNV